MSFMDRIEKIAKGFGGALQAPFGLVTDLATAPWNDDEDFNGFFNTIFERGKARGAQMLAPQAAALGAFGAPAKAVYEEALEPALRGLEWAYREGVSEPIQTVQYVNDRTDPFQGDGWGAAFDGDVWSRGYELANSGKGSPGKNFAYSTFGAPLDDDEARAAAENSTGFGTISASVDAAVRLFADPTVVGAKGIGAARTAALVKPIKPGADFDKITASSRFGRFNESLEGKSAAEIRHRFFPNDPNGAAIATVLSEAGDMPTRTRVLRAMMGDAKVVDEIRAERADLAGAVDRLTGQQSVLNSLNDDYFALANAGDALAVKTAEIDALYPQVDRLARMDAVTETLQAVPRARLTDQARSSITRSEIYQKNPLMAPVRVTFNMRPQRLVDLNRPDGDVQISRFLRRAALPLEQQDALRMEYMAALNPGQRQAVLLKAEETVIAKLAADANMTPAELQELTARAAKGRATASDILQSRVYDGEGRSRITYVDDSDGVTHELPLMVSQEANMLPLADLDRARAAASRIGQFRLRHPQTEIPTELLDFFYRTWKPSVLLRVGWPLRVVGDEQMRIMSKIGALGQLKHLTEGIANKASNELDRAAAVATRGDQTPEEALAGATKNRIGEGTLRVGDYTLEKAFGVAGEENVYRTLASSRATFDKMVGREEAAALKQLRESTGQWKSLAPQEKGYGSAWQNAVNNQIGRDEMARQFLAGRSLDDVTKWLRTTPEGQAYQRRLPYRRSNLKAWAGAVQDQVESYTLGSEAIKQLALTQRATTDDLARIAPDAAQRPVVHGEILADTLGNSETAKWFKNTIQSLYNNLGSKPSDTLSRHPFFSAMYEAEAKRLVDLRDSQLRKEGRRLSDSDLIAIQSKSREYALGQTRKLLYDLAEESDLAHLLRFVSPFYSAWQETITRWAGITVENPAYIARLHQVWASPERAGIITDEQGNPVGPGEETYDSDGKPTKIRYVTLRIPKWAKDFPGVNGGLDHQGTVRFNKRSFNLALQGAPGFGPTVQVPVNEIVKDRPALADSLAFILPFGATQDTKDLLLPATAKRLQSRMDQEGDQTYRNAALRIYFDKVVDFNTGKRETKPTWAEAKKEANAFFNLRTVASWVLPAAPGFQSPYQPYIDAFRRLKEADPETADVKFLEQFGPEYFALTQSITRSVDGVAPTRGGFEARKKYQSLIETYPELGGLIVGSEGAGEFSRSVYNAQLGTPLKPGSDRKQRQAQSFEDVETKPEERLGWIEYSKAMDLIEAARVERGLPNLQVKAADDLQLLKRAAVAKIEQKYPAWAEAFGQTDRNAMQKRLDGMRAILGDKRIAARPEMQGLSAYLQMRELVKGVLAQRESTSIDSVANADLAFVWSTLTARLVERNLAFSDLFYRYLDRDTLEAD